MKKKKNNKAQKRRSSSGRCSPLAAGAVTARPLSQRGSSSRPRASPLLLRRLPFPPPPSPPPPAPARSTSPCTRKQRRCGWGCRCCRGLPGPLTRSSLWRRRRRRRRRRISSSSSSCPLLRLRPRRLISPSSCRTSPLSCSCRRKRQRRKERRRARLLLLLLLLFAAAGLLLPPSTESWLSTSRRLLRQRGAPPRCPR